MGNFLVIAGSSTIGQVTTTLLKNSGHNVFTTGRSGEKITPDAILDATDFEQMDSVFEQAQRKIGTLDGAVNFSGSLLLKPAHLVTKMQYEEVIQSSLTTAFATVRSAGKFINGGGSIVLISSSAASIGLANHEAIAAAKAGVIGLMLSAAATYASKNLRVNVVAPGLVESDLTQKIISNPASLSYSLGMHPLGRIGKPLDIARAVVFLLDPENSWITGQVLNVDGGLGKLKTK